MAQLDLQAKLAILADRADLRPLVAPRREQFELFAA